MGPPFWTTYRGVVIAEGFFAFTLETLRVKTQSLMGYEMTLKFADQSKNQVMQTELLCIIAIITAILGWLADGYAGKVYITFTGVGAAIVCCFLAIAAHVDNFSKHKDDLMVVTTTLLFLYISTSGIRNAFILEQSPASTKEEIHIFRRYISYLIYIRIAIRCASYAFHTYAYDDNNIWAVIFIIGAISGILYFIWLKFVIPHFFLETVYFRIWENCIKCFILAYINKPHRYKLSSRDEIMKHLQPEEAFPYHEALLVKEPKTTLVKWGFRGIMRDDPPEPEDETKADRPEPPKPALKTWLRSFVSFSHKKDDPKPPVVIPRAPPRHWLFHSKPICSEYLIWQAIGLRSIFLIIIPGAFMSTFVLFFMETAHSHLRFVILPFEKLNEPDSTMCWMAMDLISFPLMEFVIYPCFRRCKLTDLHLILFAYILLFAGTLIFLHIQVGLETHLQYIPRRLTGQVRIYNALSTQSAVTSSWFGVRHINPDEYVLIKDIHMNSREENKHIRIENPEFKLKEDVKNFHLIEKRTISYIIIPGGIEKNDDKDPSLYEQKNTPNACLFYLVTPVKFPEFLLNISKSGQDVKTMTGAHRELIHLEPKTLYNLSWSYDVIPVHFKGHLNLGPFEPASMNVLFVYLDYMRFKVFVVDGPLWFSYYYLMVPLLLLSLANAMASTSYYRFVFLESPEKMRSTMFSFILSLNIFSMALFQAYFSTSVNYTVVFIVGQVVVFFLIVFLSANYRFKISTV